jgi:hypothetical protein
MLSNGATGPLRVGLNSNGGKYFTMDLRMLALAPSVISDANITNIYNEATTLGWLT